MSVQRSSIATEERDVYEELLTQQEIQNTANLVNSECTNGLIQFKCPSVKDIRLIMLSIWKYVSTFAVLTGVQKVNQAIDLQDKEALLASLRLPVLGILSILDANSQCYLEHFTSYRAHKAKVGMAM